MGKPLASSCGDFHSGGGNLLHSHVRAPDPWLGGVDRLVAGTDRVDIGFQQVVKPAIGPMNMRVAALAFGSGGIAQIAVIIGIEQGAIDRLGIKDPKDRQPEPIEIKVILYRGRPGFMSPDMDDQFLPHAALSLSGPC